MKFCNIDDYTDVLKIQPAKLASLIRDYIIYLKDGKKLSPATVSAYIAPISHFCEMNDVILNWKQIKKFKAKSRNVIEDRPYSRQQIKVLIDAAPLRDKCIILLMSSAGLRRGALEHLRIRDLQKIEKYNLYKIHVYKKEQEEYTTYCTPECTRLIEEYLKWRERLGEKLQPNTPLFRTQFDTVLSVNKPKVLNGLAIAKMIARLINDVGIRPPTITNQKRTELMQCHGFRKFFKTTCITAGMNPLYSEYVMGHRSGLTKSYFKPSDTELLEGNDKALGYVSAINELTINEENRLRKKLNELAEKKEEIEIMEIRHNQELKAMRLEMEEKFQQIISKIDTGRLS